MNFSTSTCTFLSTPSGSIIVPSITPIIVYVGFILIPLMFLKVANDIKLIFAPKSHRSLPRKTPLIDVGMLKHHESSIFNGVFASTRTWQSLVRDIHFTLVGCSFIRTRVCNILRQHEMHPMTELQIFRRTWKDEMRESQSPSQWYGRSFFGFFYDISVTFAHFHIFYDI